MPKVKADNFIELLGKCGLVDHDQLTATLDELRRQFPDQPITDGELIAEHFVAAGVLTRWQADKLLEGRHRAFFLGKYKLLGHLGTGGMSSVYLAENMLMHRRVAIKVLPTSRVSDPAYLTRFYNEARAAGALAHPNIVHTYDIDNEKNIHYIVMEYVPGKNLQEIVKTDGPLSARRSADYIAQAADGLAYAHEAGLVHRDVKPANLVVDDKGAVKVLDLGLAYFSVEGQTSLTMASDDNVLGTADYLAPEQAINSHTVDARADIYSLGCTLYFLLTGHPPFDEGPIPQRLLAHQSKEPPSIFKQRPTAPPELVDICQRMMAKKADDRYQSMTAVAEALRVWLDNNAAASSSGHMRRISDSPSGIFRGSPSSSGRLRPLPGDTTSNMDRPTTGGRVSGLSGGSSVLGRELRAGGGSSQSGGAAKLPAAGADTSEDLELAVLADDKPVHAGRPPGPATKSPGPAPATGKPGEVQKPAEPAAPAKSPADFTSWLSEELAKPATVGAETAAQHRVAQPSQAGFWIAISVGGAAALIVGIGLALFLL